MAELGFVIKCFVFSVLLILGAQIKISGVSIEDRSQAWLQNSSISRVLNQVAAGGVALLKDAGRTTADFFSSNFGGSNNEGVAKAGRLNLDMKRSDGYHRSQDQ